MPFAIVSDLDKRSAVPGKKPKWRAVLKRVRVVQSPIAAVFVPPLTRPACFSQGDLVYDGASKTFSVEWKSDVELTSAHGEAGRGMELSELVMWNGRLYSIDDRSGIVFEIVDPKGPAPHVTPQFILTEGAGDTDKGLKGEWMTVKDGQLYVASFGKEYANNDGTIKNTNNNWIAVIDKDGQCVLVVVVVVVVVVVEPGEFNHATPPPLSPFPPFLVLVFTMFFQEKFWTWTGKLTSSTRRAPLTPASTCARWGSKSPSRRSPTTPPTST